MEGFRPSLLGPRLAGSAKITVGKVTGRKIPLATDDSESAKPAEGLVAELANAVDAIEVMVATVIRTVDLIHTTSG